MKGRKTTAWFVKVQKSWHTDRWEVMAVGIPATAGQRQVELAESHECSSYRRRIPLESLDETRDAAFERAVGKAKAAEEEARERLSDKKAALRALTSAQKTAVKQ